MASNKPQFILRGERETLDKMKYIAEQNKRSMNQEIMYMIEKKIESYEAQHGEIDFSARAENQTAHACEAVTFS